MTKCEHKKWGKWHILNSVEGVTLQERSCKKCGWTETEITDVWKPVQFRTAFKELVIEIIEELKAAKPDK